MHRDSSKYNNVLIIDISKQTCNIMGKEHCIAYTCFRVEDYEIISNVIPSFITIDKHWK